MSGPSFGANVSCFVMSLPGFAALPCFFRMAWKQAHLADLQKRYRWLDWVQINPNHLFPFCSTSKILMDFTAFSIESLDSDDSGCLGMLENLPTLSSWRQYEIM